MHTDKSVKERLLSAAKKQRGVSDFWALSDISLDVASGTTVGLVGHNGSGKSTLLKAIGGIIQPTSGSVARRGRMAALLELGAGFHPDLTGRENVYLNAAILGLSRQDTDRCFDSIVEFSGIESFIDTQVKFYSSGMYVRLAFSVAIHVDPDLLLVDEVLAVGDEPFQRKCMDKIAEFQNEGRTIVLVSHSAEQVGSLCDRVVVLNSGHVVHDGDPAEGIRVLRDGYEDKRQSSAAAAGLHSGRTPYEILSVEKSFMDAREETLRIDVKVNVHEPQAEWGIGLSLENSLGARIYGMTTFDTESVLPNSRGEHTVSIDLPHLRLGAGQYLVNIGLGDRHGLTFHRIPAATSFAVPRDDIGHGLIRVQPSVQIR
ncbi:ABC transporter ATP-binding protein [Mycetocola zhadangensis]